MTAPFLPSARQVGASKKLGIVIEGESLLNDGTAFVLFLVFQVLPRVRGLNSTSAPALHAILIAARALTPRES